MDYFFSLIYSLFILFSLFLFNFTHNFTSINNDNTVPIQNEFNINNNIINNDYSQNQRQLSSLPKDLFNLSIFNSSFLNSFHKKRFINMWNIQLKEKFFDGEANYTNITNKKINTGLMNLRIFLPKENRIKEDLNPFFKMRITENKTADKWIFISKNIKIKTLFDIYNDIKVQDENITMHYYNETFLNLSYISKLEKGEYFSVPYSKKICNITYTINFLVEYVNKTVNNKTWKEKEITGIKGSLNSQDCKIEIDFNLEGHSKTYHKISSSVVLYCLFSSLLSLLHLFTTKLLINKIDFSTVNHSSISIFTICQNIIWNSYCCYSHFYLLLNFIEFKLYLSIVCALYFFNFGVLEFPLLYQLLSLKYSHMINDILAYRKKLIQFCFIFYLIMLFCFIFAMKCFYSSPFIFLSFAFTFLPQIIYNINKKNRVSFPIIYIISLFLNRSFPSFYFCTFENNFLRIPTNRYDIFINNIFLLFFALVLYSQTLFGPKWFIFIKDENDYDFYIDEKKLRKIKKNETDNLECLICLLPIIPQKKNNLNNDINNNNYGFNETDNLVLEVNGINIDNFENKKFCCKFKYKDKCFGEKSIFLNFHEFSKNINNLPYMITPCKHVFHSDCLEEWFKMKKECPSCRSIITQEMYD